MQKILQFIADVFQHSHPHDCACKQCHTDETPEAKNFPPKNNHIMDDLLMQDWLASTGAEGFPGRRDDTPVGEDWIFSKNQTK